MALDLKELEQQWIRVMRGCLLVPSIEHNVSYINRRFPDLLAAVRRVEVAEKRITELERERDAWKLAAQSKSSAYTTKEEMDAIREEVLNYDFMDDG